MTASPRSTTSSVASFERVQLVDHRGRVRILLGDLGPGAGIGIALVDEAGRKRLVASLDEGGPVLVLDQEGNIRLEVGVHDPATDAVHVGPYVLLNDDDGRPAIGVYVEQSGEVRFVGAAPEPWDSHGRAHEERDSPGP